jgi:hypothetical protein
MILVKHLREIDPITFTSAETYQFITACPGDIR